MRRFLSGPTLDLRVGQASIRARVERKGASAWSAEAGYESPAELSELIGRLAGECTVRCRHARVSLDRPPAQLRTLTDLPPIGDRDLAALVAHQVGRIFRRNGNSLVCDALWVVRNGSRVAQAAAVEEALVEAIAAGARAAGLVLDTIDVADAGATLALLPGPERAARARAARDRTRTMTLATAGIWLVVVVVFVVRLVGERRAVDRELARLQAPLASVLAARREIHGVAAALAAIGRADRERGRALAFLAAATAALSDSAIITSLTWSPGGPTVLSGAALQGSKVLAALQDVPAGGSPAFDGPVVRETVAGRNWDRFTIVFKPPVASKRART